MTCADCEEPITETERKNARTCAGCAKPLHDECAMLGPAADDFCEACLHREGGAFTFRMMRGSEA